MTITPSSYPGGLPPLDAGRWSDVVARIEADGGPITPHPDEETLRRRAEHHPKPQLASVPIGPVLGNTETPMELDEEPPAVPPRLALPRPQEVHMTRPRKGTDTGRAVGAHLENLRKQRGLTIPEVASRMQVDRSYVYQIEHYGRDLRMDTVRRYCDAIGAHIHIRLKEVP